MAIVGFGIAFAGYSLIYYGLTQVRGFNFGFLDLVIPGRFASVASNPKDGVRDNGSPGSVGGAAVAPGNTAGAEPKITQTPAPAGASPNSSAANQGRTSGSPGVGVTQTKPGYLA